MRDLALNNSRRYWDEIRRLKSNGNLCPEISLNEFYEHFKDVYSISEPFRDADVEASVFDLTK